MSPRSLAVVAAGLLAAGCAAGYGGYGAAGDGAGDGAAGDGAAGEAVAPELVRLTSEECAPPTENQVARAFDAATLAGSWSLWLFADEGEATGASAGGWLVLEAYAADEAPLFGGTPASARGHLDLDLASLGAAGSGDPTSRSDDGPGVLVLQTERVETDRAAVTLRLGDRSNRLDRMAFDDAYNALRLTTAGDSTFAGRWQSGTARGPIAGGRFCAVRTPAGGN